MFSKLALKNIRRSIKDYAIYFFTLVLGVAIFYVFNSLGSQTVMLEVTSNMRDLIDLMNSVLSGVSVFVAFVLGFLIIYATRFLMKRRSHEFGIYLTLGMSKRKVSKILLLETFFIGLISLAIGLVVGVLLSQLTSVLVANLFEADLTRFHFIFSGAACVKTLICFGIIYLIVMIFNVISVGRQKLINLLSSNRRNEAVKFKNPILCTIIFIIACAMLAWAYWAVTGGIETVLQEADEMILVVLAVGALATFLLFWSLSGLLLKIFMSWKKVYYRRLNSFTLRQFSSKINTTVFSMTMICLMLFVTICVLGSAMSIRNSMASNLRKSLPVDAQISQIGHAPVDIVEDAKQDGLDLENILENIETYKIYNTSEVTLSESLGPIFNQLEEKSISYDHNEDVMYESDYNIVAKTYDLPTVDLASDEYAVVANFATLYELRSQALSNNTEIKVGNRTLHPQSKECIIGGVTLSANADNAGVIILPDDVKMSLSENDYYRTILIGNYRDPSRAIEYEEQIENLSNRFFENDPGENGEDVYYYSVSTRQKIIDNSVGLSAMVTFIGLYLGFIFLIASAAILALKELSESSDNRNKFVMLRKIGASEKMLNRALFSQIAIFFAFPLLIAILHSIFGIMFCSFILEIFGGLRLADAIFFAGGVIVVIYGGYFLITYFCSKNIIRAQHS